MIKILKKLNILLNKKQKRSMVGLIFLMIIGAMLEALSLSALIPVIQAIMTENAIENNALLSGLYKFLGCKNNAQFTIIIMVIVIGLFALKNIFLYVQQKCTLHFVYGNQFDTSERMMKSYLRKDYEFYLNADTAVVQRNITSDVNNMYALILSILTVVSEVIVFLFLLVICLRQDAFMTLFMGAIMLVLLLVIQKVIKPVMQKTGKDNQDFYSRLFKQISQTVQGIKEVKIGAKENYFISDYVTCGRNYVNAVQKYSILNAMPKLLIEFVCIAALMGYVIFMIAVMHRKPIEMSDSLVALAAVALRMLPCVNRIQNQVGNIAFFEPYLMGVSDTLQDDIGNEEIGLPGSVKVEKLPVKEIIRMDNVTYAYPGTEKLIFDHAAMEIPVGAAVGVVGPSGAGKTTIVDVLLGLLNMKEGSITADGVDVQTNYQGWLKNIGYIPQMIFMLDDTIRRNVAFGVPDDEISEERVWAVLKEAQLDEYVRSLPEGLDTTIGERGIRISGGQRQRIGIARALYEDPEVLILDEATSALDNDTETAIMESINRFCGKKTLLIIAHRLQTIEKCNIVYRVENGKITKQ